MGNCSVLNSGFFAQNLKQFHIIDRVVSPVEYFERNL